MSYDLLLAFTMFAAATSVTPGPNNVMLLASGVNFGFARSIPHILGIALGFMIMLVLVGFGLGKVFETYPPLFTVLKYGGGLYLLYLAWKIANSGPVSGGEGRGTPMTLVQAAAFQWVNPKAWVMAIGAITAYTVPTQFALSVFVVAVIFGAIGLLAMVLWTLFGTALRNWLNDPKTLRVFNWTMAVLLIVSLWPIIAL